MRGIVNAEFQSEDLPLYSKVNTATKLQSDARNTVINLRSGRVSVLQAAAGAWATPAVPSVPLSPPQSPSA